MKAEQIIDAILQNEEDMRHWPDRLNCCSLMEEIVRGMRTDLLLDRDLYFKWAVFQETPVFQLFCTSSDRADGLRLMIMAREHTWTMDLRHPELFGPVSKKGGRKTISGLHRALNYHLDYLNIVESRR